MIFQVFKMNIKDIFILPGGINIDFFQRNYKMVTIIIALLIILLLIALIVLGVSNQPTYMTPTQITVQEDPHGEKKHQATSLVLSCLDYRFIGPTIEHLYQRSKAFDFDYFVLAGASLGYNESIQPEPTVEIPEVTSRSWHDAFEDHIRLARTLHNIRQIIVIDHQECGYYHAVYGAEVATSKQEAHKHEYNIHKFIQTMKSNPEFSDLKYTGLLIEVEEPLRFRVIYEEESISD